jgi:hypothetical protein
VAVTVAVDQVGNVVESYLNEVKLHFLHSAAAPQSTSASPAVTQVSSCWFLV